MSNSSYVALVQCPCWTIEDPPLGLAYLTAALRRKEVPTSVFDFGLELYNQLPDRLRPYFHADQGLDRDRESIGLDAMVEERINGWAQRVLDSGARIVGLSMFFTTEEISLKLARRIKELDPGAAIVFGGPSCNRNVHADKFLQTGLPDIVVTGEGEETIVELVEAHQRNGRLEAVPGALALRDGQLLDGGERPLIADIDAIPFPDFDDLMPLGYGRKGVLSVTGSRGCPNRCKYCSERGFWGKYRCRSGENLFAEIKLHAERFGVYRFNLVDSIINADLKKLERFCDLVIESGLPIRWYGMAMPRPQMGPEILSKMRAAGCVLLQYGIESLSPRVRKEMGKSDDIRMVERVLRDTHDAGIRIHGLMIIGFPGEQRRDYWRTMWGIVRLRKVLDYVVRPTCPCVLLPNSILFQEREGFGIGLDGDKYAEWTTASPASDFKSRSRDLERFKRLLDFLGIPGELPPDIFDLPADATGAWSMVPEEKRRFEVLQVLGPDSIEAGSDGLFKVRLRNPTDRYWPASALSDGRPIGLAYHWLNSSGEVVIFDDSQRAYLRKTASPGEIMEHEVKVSAPKQSGSYLLEICVVQDGVGWFEPVVRRDAIRQVRIV